jgi:hypothetical protein
MPANLCSIALELSVDDKRRFNESQGTMIMKNVRIVVWALGEDNAARMV